MKVITLLLLLYCSVSYSQYEEYFKGKNLYCGSTSPEAIDYATKGLAAIRLNYFMDPQIFEKTADLFLAAVKKDSTFCDAYFFAGYSLSLINKPQEALPCYYMADSLAQNKSLLFKVNLAATALRMGAIELARKKYEEINKYFPYTHEGHYGYAVTSTMLGDHDKGLQQIYIAIYKYKKKYDKEPEDALFLKAVLLSMNNRHEDAVSTFKSIDKEYLEHDAYKVHYAYSLFKVAEIDDDEKIRKQAFKLYDKIKDKNAIPKEYDIQLLDKQ